MKSILLWLLLNSLLFASGSEHTSTLALEAYLSKLAELRGLTDTDMQTPEKSSLLGSWNAPFPL